MTRYAFYIDTTRCTGCETCVTACKGEFLDNDWTPYSAAQPLGQFWMNYEKIERGQLPGKFKYTNVPFLCNHCENAPCQKAATNGAVYTRPDGLVIIDPVLSAGQKQIVSACPYGVIYWNSTLNIPQKCTGCAHIVDNGVPQGVTEPRCVAACPTGAITWGDYSTVIQPAVAAAGALPLHPEYGTSSMVFYNGLPGKFIAGSVFSHATDLCLSGATITATPLGGGAAVTTTSDTYGDFWLDGLPANTTFTVTVTNSGMLSRTMLAYTGNDVDLGDIEMF